MVIEVLERVVAKSGSGDVGDQRIVAENLWTSDQDVHLY